MAKTIISINVDSELLDKIELEKKEQKPELTRGQYIEVACWEKINRDEKRKEKQS